MSTPALLLLLGLAAARMTRLVVDDEITAPVRRWVLNRRGAESRISYLLHCRWCAGVWVSACLSTFTWAAGLCTLPVAALLIPAVAYASALIGAMIEE